MHRRLCRWAFSEVARRKGRNFMCQKVGLFPHVMCYGPMIEREIHLIYFLSLCTFGASLCLHINFITMDIFNIYIFWACNINFDENFIFR